MNSSMYFLLSELCFPWNRRKHISPEITILCSHPSWFLVEGHYPQNNSCFKNNILQLHARHLSLWHFPGKCFPLRHPPLVCVVMARASVVSFTVLGCPSPCFPLPLLAAVAFWVCSMSTYWVALLSHSTTVNCTFSAQTSLEACAMMEQSLHAVFRAA
jgi:hypothetical protein